MSLSWLIQTKEFNDGDDDDTVNDDNDDKDDNDDDHDDDDGGNNVANRKHPHYHDWYSAAGLQCKNIQYVKSNAIECKIEQQNAKNIQFCLIKKQCKNIQCS